MSRPTTNVRVWVVVLTAGTVALAVAVLGLFVWPTTADQPVERTGMRTATVAMVAAIGAGVSLWVSLRSHLHTVNDAADRLQEQRADRDAHEARHRLQIAADQARADRLHVTQLFDSAAEKLGADDDATRTAGVLILERVYDDARVLFQEPSRSSTVGDSQARSLQRAIIETLCAYIRDRSRRDSDTWHQAAGLDNHEELNLIYSSPSSVRAAIGVLGRLQDPPPGATYDIGGSHLADVVLAGTFGADLDATKALIGRDVWFAGSFRDVILMHARFTADARFVEIQVRGQVNLTGVRVGKTVLFDHAIISGLLSLYAAEVQSGVSLMRARIGGHVLASSVEATTFNAFACSIGGRLWLEQAQLSLGLEAQQAAIAKDVSLRLAEVGGISVREARIGGNLAMQKTTVRGALSLHETVIEGDGLFHECTVDGNTSFNGAAVTKAPRRGRLDLDATTWNGRVWGLPDLRVGGLAPTIHLAGTTFADARDDPATPTG